MKKRATYVTGAMKSKELVCRALLGDTIPRYPCAPLAVYYTAALSGITIREYTTDPQILAYCVVRYYENFLPDAVWVSADTWVTAEAMGARVGFLDDNQPMCGLGDPLVTLPVDIDRIPPAKPDLQGRMSIIYQTLEIVKRRLGDEVFIVACFDQSPFSLACCLVGIEQIMLKLFDDLPFVDALTERCIEYIIEYAIYLSQAGPDMLSTGDSPAGMIGAELYSQIALPAEQRVFAETRRNCDTFLSLHICGKTDHILPSMIKAGSDVLEIDYKTDIQYALDVVPDNIGLWGNIDPVAVLWQGKPRMVRPKYAQKLKIKKQNDKSKFKIIG